MNKVIASPFCLNSILEWIYRFIFV